MSDRLEVYKRMISSNKKLLRKHLDIWNKLISKLIDECEYNDNDIEKVSYKLAIKTCDEELESITDILQNILKNLDGTNKDDYKFGLPKNKVDENTNN